MPDHAPPAQPEPPPPLAFGGVLPYAPALESLDGISLAPRYDLYLDGAPRAPRTPTYRKATNAATFELLAEVAIAAPADVDDAVESARIAFEGSWGTLRPIDRSKLLFRLAIALEDFARELSLLSSLESGLPIRCTRDLELPSAAAHLFHYAGWADKVPHAIPGRNHRPRAVTAHVLPEVFPLLNAVRAFAPAVAAGSTCVLLPREDAALAVLTLADRLHKAGLPEGVINVLPSDAATRAAVVRHPGVGALSIAAPTDEEPSLVRALVARGVPFISVRHSAVSAVVFADAALDQAVDSVASGLAVYNGELFRGANRVFIEESAHEAFRDKLRRRLGTVRVGTPLDRNTDVGPLRSAAAAETLRKLIEESVVHGAVAYASSAPLPTQGAYFPPTLLDDVAPNDPIARADVHGPVVSIITFRTADEAVERANNTTQPLAVNLWSGKAERALWVASRLRSASIWINASSKVDPSIPVGASVGGFGTRGEGMAPYVEVDWA